MTREQIISNFIYNRRKVNTFYFEILKRKMQTIALLKNRMNFKLMDHGLLGAYIREVLSNGAKLLVLIGLSIGTVQSNDPTPEASAMVEEDRRSLRTPIVMPYISLALHMDEESNRRIHFFLQTTLKGLRIPYGDEHYSNNRHVNIYWVQNVQVEHCSIIKRTLREVVDKKQLTFTPSRVGRYTPRRGRQTLEACPLVLFPMEKEADAFRHVNRIVEERLRALCKEMKFPSYQLTSEEYLPHMTLLNQPILRLLNIIDRKDEVITALNAVVQKEPLKWS